MPVSSAGLRILSATEVIEQLRELRAKQPVKYTAFYSSQLRGIVTDPALMVIPFDDLVGREDPKSGGRNRHTTV